MSRQRHFASSARGFLGFCFFKNFPHRTNSLLTPCKQGAVLSRYSNSSFILFPPPNVKKCGFENKYLLTFSRSTSPQKAPTLRRKIPQTPRKKFLSNVKFFTSEVFYPFFWPKKEEKTRLFRALSSSLVQRYNIFRRNPNCVNTSQHSINRPFAAICSRRGLACVILRGGSSLQIFPPRCSVAAARRKPGFSDIKTEKALPWLAFSF